jgi:ankyrin repeat protein
MVFCQLEVLRWTLPVDIRSSLDDMPKTLDETYERALLAINAEMRQYAQRLFQSLAVSVRPLHVEELADILAVRFNAGALPKFSPDWRLGDAEEAVLSVCSNLIGVVDVDGSQVVQFSHFSVKEFLMSDRLASAGEDISGYHIVLQSAHTIIAQACLGVLLQLDDHIDKDSINGFPLSGYAAQHWVDHGQFQGVSSAIQAAMEYLFNPDKPHFSTWVWIYDMDDPWRGEMPSARPEQPEAAPLYYAVLCGFRQLIEHLISSYPGDLDARGGYYETPLLAAFVNEDTDTALSLLQRGADANVLDKSGTGPLHRASQSGDIDTVHMLLEHNAAVDLPNTESDTPFIMACVAGEIGVLRLLQQRGTDLNLHNKVGLSPLHVSAGGGHLDVARFLIESGAEVNSCDSNGWTPLHSASQGGHVKIAELLIQNGADVGSRDSDGWTPLHSASQGGHVKISELLIQHGADVGSRDSDGWTPLHSASAPEGGHVKIAELLIQHGADVDSRDSDGWTPLHSASEGGHVEIAELLIQRGADVGSRDSDGWTPFYSASRSGHVKMAELLIQHGSDVGSRHNKRPDASACGVIWR